MNNDAQTLKSLADPNRLRLVRLLGHAGRPLCVCEIVDSLLIPQYAVSRNLKALEAAGLVVSAKKGKWVYYSIPRRSDSFRDALLGAIEKSIVGLSEEVKNRLSTRLRLRKNGRCELGIQNEKLLARSNRPGRR
jgi:ArsR family transcriptional regulator